MAPNLAKSGFLDGDSLSGIACPAGAHKFELIYSSPGWQFLGAYFGGRIGTCVYFPGGRIADFLRCDVEVPVNGKEWSINKSGIYLPPHQIRTLWGNLSVIIPSMPIRHRGSRKRVEQRQRRDVRHSG